VREIYLQDFIKLQKVRISGQSRTGKMFTHLDQISEYHVPVRFEDRERNEQQELVRVVIGPEDLPEAQHLVEWELALERDQDPSEAEEQVQRLGFLCNRGLESVRICTRCSNSPK